MTRSTYLLLAFGASVVAALVGFGGSAAHSDAAALCKTKLIGRTAYYCGPATARLSIFPGVTFKNGICLRQTLKSGPLLSLGLGVQTRNAATNGGRPLFGLTISGPLSHPTGGGVNAYWKSKHWGGAGVSFTATANGGNFVVRGIRGSQGTATGSFRC